jgi:hypothetical protein
MPPGFFKNVVASPEPDIGNFKADAVEHLGFILRQTDKGQ